MASIATLVGIFGMIAAAIGAIVWAFEAKASRRRSASS